MADLKEDCCNHVDVKSSEEPTHNELLPSWLTLHSSFGMMKIIAPAASISRNVLSLPRTVEMCPSLISSRSRVLSK